MPTKEKRIRYAVIGLGNIAQVAILPAFEHAKENSELGALISSDTEKLKRVGAHYGVFLLGGYDEMEDILRRGDIDAVYIAVPNSKHRELVERAARAHVHVLCEKPMAVTEDACHHMIRAAADNQVKLMIAYRLHFEEANTSAIELIRGGAIGEPRIFSSVFTQQVRDDDVRTRNDLGGGALYDMGIYCLNAARYLFQDEPVEVFAFQARDTEERFRGVDEMTTAVLRFSNDRLAQFTVSQGASDVSQFRLVGTKGDIELDPAFGYSGPLKQALTQGGKKTEKSFGPYDQFAPELVHFSRCILEDNEPEPSGEEGLADVRVLEALVKSAKTGAPVELARFERKQRPDRALAMKKPPVKTPKTVNAPSPSVK
ncbi:MAG TPA: Gfo/Idh/MocA family oxidoreductase [Polyangiaceae bacterium]|nr:Gfo/Idh/MocA family oxidoreductase [Polyangiaceae bacterium]